jgi:hypothetical protein
MPAKFDDDGTDDDSNVNLAAKYRYQSKSNDDENGELNDEDANESAEDISQSKYTTYPTKTKFQRYSSDEDSDEDDEISKQDQREKLVGFDQQHNEKLSNTDKERGKLYQEEFDEQKAFRKKQMKFSKILLS